MSCRSKDDTEVGENGPLGSFKSELKVHSYENYDSDSKHPIFGLGITIIFGIYSFSWDSQSHYAPQISVDKSRTWG